ncbi:MAG: MBOAT family protein [Bacteroidaceae bacterium]|nr:MBOAT family protein [Bacteroidaceae bacterium]
MLFNSLEFLLFLPIVFAAYWSLRSWKWQNVLVVVASYVFYGWWDWRFLLLISFTTVCSFLSGVWMDKLGTDTPRTRSYCKWISAGNIIINLSILGVFKYFNFFADSFADLMSAFGWNVDRITLKVILPVGISFYTFQALSYSIDVYKGKIKATTDVVAFFAYISFFPQLVAGPIERATNLLPQFLRAKTFDYQLAKDGARLILWGFFKKICVADNAAKAVDAIYGNIDGSNSTMLWIAAILFTFQIYGDFSGYSDIAIGTARLFGVRLLKNFNLPYISRDIAEFWRRWHISLNKWFIDYIYIPLGGSRVSKAKVLRNTFVIFLVSGLWHGANWTFILWGLYHALLFVPLILLGKNRKNMDVVAANTVFPSLKELLQIAGTFALAVIGWIIFRADNLTQLSQIVGKLLNPDCYGAYQGNIGGAAIVSIAILVTLEWFFRKEDCPLRIPSRYKAVRWAGYYFVAMYTILQYQVAQQFIYFQF